MMKCVSSHFATPIACLATFVLLLSCSMMTAFAAEVASESPPEGDLASDDRPFYTEDTRPDFPVFNSLEGEENFLSVECPDGTVFRAGGDALELQMGQEYKVVIAYDNNGLPSGITTHAITSDAKVQVDFPFSIANEKSMTATISAANSRPTAVSSSLTLVAPELMNLEVVSGSVRIVNNNPTNNSIISEKELFGEGALFGTNSMVGIVLYGSENAGSITFSFRTVPFTEATSVFPEAGAIEDGHTLSGPNASEGNPGPFEGLSQADKIMLGVSVVAAIIIILIIISTILIIIDRHRAKTNSIDYWED